MHRTTLLSLLLAIGTALAARTARASSDYPQAIINKAFLRYTPACTLCHAETDGSDGVVATDFGRTLWAFGMRGSDVASLERALDKDLARRWDTDGDGVPDIEELIASTDPSGPALSNFPDPEHGCAVASIRPSERGPDGLPRRAATVIGALGILVALRRRPRSRGR